MDEGRLIGLMVALGAGLLVGLERERRKGQGAHRRAAGVRTFTLAASAGALAQWLSPQLVWVGAALVAALAVASYLKSRSRDPGLTTELALFITYLVGVSAVMSPTVGAAGAVTLAAVLAARSALHRFATEVLSEQELHDALLLLGLGLVVMPLLPSDPLPWLGGLGLRPLGGLVWLLLLMQGMAHVALRLLGPRLGLAAAGFLMGFASSSATVAAMGARARQNPAQADALAVAAVLSTAATWTLVPIIAAPFSTAAAGALLPAAAAGAGGALCVGTVLSLMGKKNAVSAHGGPDRARALSLKEAVILAAGLVVVTLAMTTAQQHFGTGGVLTSAAVSGMADAHAAVAPLSGLFAAKQLTVDHLLMAVCLSILFNSVTRTVIAVAAGGRRYAGRVVLALLVGNLCAWSAAWLSLQAAR
jgi:uncharacterized membrane protein (DUF4010 family)